MSQRLFGKRLHKSERIVFTVDKLCSGRWQKTFKRNFISILINLTTRQTQARHQRRERKSKKNKWPEFRSVSTFFWGDSPPAAHKTQWSIIKFRQATDSFFSLHALNLFSWQTKWFNLHIFHSAECPLGVEFFQWNFHAAVFWVWRGDCKDENENIFLQHRISHVFHLQREFREIVLVERMKIPAFCAIRMDFFAQLLIHFISARVNRLDKEVLPSIKPTGHRLRFNYCAPSWLAYPPLLLAFLIPLVVCLCWWPLVVALKSKNFPTTSNIIPNCIDATVVQLSAAYSI